MFCILQRHEEKECMMSVGTQVLVTLVIVFSPWVIVAMVDR